jgi:hypothetical protein
MTLMIGEADDCASCSEYLHVLAQRASQLIQKCVQLRPVVELLCKLPVFPGLDVLEAG